jgi:ATP synthase protein I
MAAPPQQPGYKVVKRLIASQLAVTLILSLLFVMMSSKAAYSAMLGGLVAIVPNCIFAYRVFAYKGARSADKIISSLYRGEAIKLLITCLLLALVFRFVSVVALAFFITYIFALLVFWVFLLRVK